MAAPGWVSPRRAVPGAEAHVVVADRPGRAQPCEESERIEHEAREAEGQQPTRHVRALS